jgi:hypothetical protein
MCSPNIQTYSANKSNVFGVCVQAPKHEHEYMIDVRIQPSLAGSWLKVNPSKRRGMFHLLNSFNKRRECIRLYSVISVLAKWNVFGQILMYSAISECMRAAEYVFCSMRVYVLLGEVFDPGGLLESEAGLMQKVYLSSRCSMSS